MPATALDSADSCDCSGPTSARTALRMDVGSSDLSAADSPDTWHTTGKRKTA
jgi:hypothetical protein